MFDEINKRNEEEKYKIQNKKIIIDNLIIVKDA